MLFGIEEKGMPKSIYSLEDIVPFGMYKGDTVEQVIANNPSYLQWLYQNTKFDIDQEALNLLNILLEKIEDEKVKKDVVTYDTFSDYMYDSPDWESKVTDVQQYNDEDLPF